MLVISLNFESGIWGRRDKVSERTNIISRNRTTKAVYIQNMKLLKSKVILKLLKIFYMLSWQPNVSLKNKVTYITKNSSQIRFFETQTSGIFATKSDLTVTRTQDYLPGTSTLNELKRHLYISLNTSQTTGRCKFI